MSKSKVFSIAILTAGIIGSVAMTAIAQDAPAAAPVAQSTPAIATQPGVWESLKAKFSGDRTGFGKRSGEFMQIIMTEVDADKNGSVTQNEIDNFRAGKVTSTDTSKDGLISLEEFGVAYNELMRKRMVDAFQNLDDDGNGSITTAELNARFGAIVTRLDRNGDGVLNNADMTRPEGRGGKGQGKARGNK
jgi:EF hand